MQLPILLPHPNLQVEALPQNAEELEQLVVETESSLAAAKAALERKQTAARAPLSVVVAKASEFVKAALPAATPAVASSVSTLHVVIGGAALLGIGALLLLRARRR